MLTFGHVLLQTLREVLRFGSANDMRMPLEEEQGFAQIDSPEAVLVSKIRFQSKALGHISAAFQKIWERYVSFHVTTGMAKHVQ